MLKDLKTLPLYPKVDFTPDPALPELSSLFDPDWVANLCRQLLDAAEPAPQQVRILQFSYYPGRQAVVTYGVEWAEEDYLPTRQLVARVERDKPVEWFQFPDDRALPGLGAVANPESAVKLLNRYVLTMGARRSLVQVVRYRPGRRAVIFHRAGRAKFYVRVLPSSSLPGYLETWQSVGLSSFVAPRIAGKWLDGGVVWLSEIQGENVRRSIRKGSYPDPDMVLSGLKSLWESAPLSRSGPAFNLEGAYNLAKGVLGQGARGDAAAAASFNRATKSLDAFVKTWQPTTLAHNDFYDDQLMVLPDGRLALVDFEEIGPGDPQLDVGNFLAHLRWTAHFGQGASAEARTEFHGILRTAALERFRWNETELNLREAVCLFRICTNTVRHPQADWRRKLESGLSLTGAVIG